MRAGPDLAVGASAVLAAGLAGCGQANSSSPITAGTPSGSPATATWISSSLYRTVPLPAASEAALRTEVGPARPTLPNRLAVSPDGSEYFSTTYSSAWSGIVGVCPATGTVDQISQFPDATMFQDQFLSAAFDGQWLVWTESSTLQLPWLSALMAWNSGTNQVTTLVPTVTSLVNVAQLPPRPSCPK